MIGFIVFGWLLILDMLFVWPGKSVDTELNQYFIDYTQRLTTRCPKKHLVDQSYHINFGSLDMKIGLCSIRANGYAVVIDKEWWEQTVNPDSRRQLVSHELTHCILNKDHSPEKDHYMYFEENYVDPGEFIKQLDTDIDSYCNE